MRTQDRARDAEEPSSKIGEHPSVARTLRSAHEEACTTHPSVALDAQAYARGVVDRVTRRLERAHIAPDVQSVRRAVCVTCLPDLYLAIACDLEVVGSWERLVETHAPRIDALARSIGVHAEGGSVGRDLLADLAAPPGSGPARTRLGTYVGSGSLFAWLAVILRRHGATRARRRTSPPAPVEPASFDAQPGPHDADPLAALVDAEDGRRVVRALQAAWRTLSSREQLALHFKYGESLKLKEIGAMLALSESSTSRLVNGALQRMRDHVRPMLESGAVPAARVELWAALWQAVRPSSNAEERPS